MNKLNKKASTLTTEELVNIFENLDGAERLEALGITQLHYTSRKSKEIGRELYIILSKKLHPDMSNMDTVKAFSKMEQIIKNIYN